MFEIIRIIIILILTKFRRVREFHLIVLSSLKEYLSLTSAILCIRGYRGRKEKDNVETVAETDIQLTVLEAQLKEYN